MTIFDLLFILVFLATLITLLGGGRDLNGQFARFEAHGFYWTATEDGPASAVFYNFAKGGLSLFRQSEGEKPRAFSVPCVAE